MKTSFIIWLLCGGLVASTALNVHHLRIGASPQRPCDQGRAPCAQRAQAACPIAEELGLSESQRQRICAGCTASCARECDRRDQRVAALLTELQRELNAEALDRERVTHLADQIAALHAQEWKSRIQCIVQVRETLRPDQLERLVATVAGP